MVSVLDREIKRKVPIPLDQPQAPAVHPDGRHVIFSAIREGVADIWKLDMETGEVENLTRDEYYDNNPHDLSGRKARGLRAPHQRQPEGLRLPPGRSRAQDPADLRALRRHRPPLLHRREARLYYASDEDNDIFNIRGLDLETGAIQQYTDVFGGAMAPAPIEGPQGDRLAFITYFKGEYKLHSQETEEPVKEIDQEVRAASEGIVDFQPDITHDVIPENKRRKRLFEGLYLEGRPPINVGVTSSGDFYGGTAVALTDVLGDQLFTVQVLSVRSYRSYDFRYTNLAQPLPLRGQRLRLHHVLLLRALRDRCPRGTAGTTTSPATPRPPPAA